MIPCLCDNEPGATVCHTAVWLCKGTKKSVFCGDMEGEDAEDFKTNMSGFPE